MTLEDLLNTLIKRGWKPFGWKDIKRVNNEGWFVCFVHKTKKRPWLSEVSHRELVSKESGLWQFCVDNEMIKIKYRDRRYYNEDNHLDKVCFDDGYYYRIIEASLKDESELKQFLLDSIKVEG